MRELEEETGIHNFYLNQPGALDKRNVGKRLQATGLIIPLDEPKMDVAHRAARHRFDRERYKQLRADGSRWNE